jgi:hypothetical protein
MRSSREEWRKRVERWKDSGLTAEQYASELGINAKTLQFWKYKLGRPQPPGGRRPTPSGRERLETALPLVEVRPTFPIGGAVFQLELGGGKRLHIPATFEAEPLERLLAVLARTV